MRKRSTLIVAMGTLTVGLLSAAPAYASPHHAAAPIRKASPIQLQFWSFWGSKERRPVIEHMVDMFNKSQSQIHVTYQFLPWGEVWTKELAGVAAGNPPDAIIQDINTVAIRAQKKQAMDLTPFLKKDPLQNEFFPNLWDAMKYNGDVYGLPFNTDTRVLFYNKDLFKAAGIKNPPQTWAELDADAKKLDIKSNGQYQRIGFYPLWGNMGPDVWMMNADGGQSYLDYKNKKATIFDQPKIAALNWINGYTDRLGPQTVEQFQSQFGSGLQDPFVAGKVAMEVNIPGEYTVIRDYAPKNFHFGIVPLPAPRKGAGHWTWGGGFDVEIPVGAKHPNASWQFIKFLTGEQSEQYWGEMAFDTMANKQAMSAIAKSKALTPDGRMVYRATIDNMKWTKLTPQPWWAPGFPDLVGPLVNGAMNHQISPAAALQKAQDQVNQLIQQTISENK